MSEREKLVSGLKLAWRDEMGSARNYRALAEQEGNPDRRAILLRLAEAEEKHAANWLVRLRELGAEPGEYRESVVERARRWALLQSGTDRAVVKLEAAENGADAMYDELAKIAPSEEVRKQLTDAQQEERTGSPGAAAAREDFADGEVARDRGGVDWAGDLRGQRRTRRGVRGGERRGGRDECEWEVCVVERHRDGDCVGAVDGERRVSRDEVGG